MSIGWALAEHWMGAWNGFLAELEGGGGGGGGTSRTLFRDNSIGQNMQFSNHKYEFVLGGIFVAQNPAVEPHLSEPDGTDPSSDM